MEDKIKKVIAAVFNMDQSQINEGTSVDTLEDWDSLKHMTLIVALEEEFDIEFDQAEYFKLTDYRSIRNCLEKKVKAVQERTGINESF